MNTRRLSPLFVVLTTLFVTTLLVSNVIAGKLISVFGAVLPAAVVLFPITYIFGDVLTEVYGFRQTRLVLWLGFTANVFMALVFMLVVTLPHPAFWPHQDAYATVLGMTPRIVVASLLAYFAGEFSNSTVLSVMKKLTHGRWLWTRTIGSTVVGEGVDTLIFIAVAFYGSVPAVTLLNMILAQYAWKVIYEVLATPVTYAVVRRVKRVENVDVYDWGVKYNPFSLEV